MPILTRRRAIFRDGCVAATIVFAGCRSPQADAYLIEQLRQMGDELNASRQQAAELQSQLDSLRGVVARQDTLLTRIANLAGIPR